MRNILRPGFLCLLAVCALLGTGCFDPVFSEGGACASDNSCPPGLQCDIASNTCHSSAIDAGGNDAAADAQVGTAALSITPESASFGSVVAGNSSSAFTFTVQNSGDGASETLMVSLSGDEFTLTTDNCNGLALASSESCTISARFAPTQAGSPTATLLVSDGDGEVSATLSGTGLVLGALQLSPSDFDFGTQLVDETSAEHVFTVTNTGGSTSGSLSTNLDDAVNFRIAGDTCTGTLAPADTCEVRVTFSTLVAAGHLTSLIVSASPGGSAASSLVGTATECSPSTVSCAGGDLTTCNSSGVVSSTETCALGCFDGSRCTDIDPSNGLGVYLDMTSTAPDVILTDGATIDTANGEVTDAGGTVLAIPFEMLTAPADGVPILVLKVGSFQMSGTVTLEGVPALAIVSNGDIGLAGTLELGGSGRLSDDGLGCGGGPGEFSATLGGAGGGGGGFGSSGRSGGSLTPIASGLSGGVGGTVSGNTSLIPLRGGCQGGIPPGGGVGGLNFPRGGGALQLVSRTSIRITGGGFIDAGGGNGRTYSFLVSGGQPNLFVNGGTGGASGGGVLLEAPVVQIDASSGIAANGGSGGCRSMIGTSGLLSSSPAPGAACTASDPTFEGPGGDGAADIAATSGTGVPHATNQNGRAGGGGGGGVGRIRVNTFNNQFTVAGSGVVSPAASVAAVGTR